jgi:hypothetical protein
MNFAEADAIDDDELSTILWHAIKGPKTPEPTKRYGVARSRPRDDD